jgi:predicted metal-dependent peptidase
MKAREELESIGNKIWNEIRTELYLSYRFMNSAFGSLAFRMDMSTASVGTDSVYLLFNPEYSFHTYMDSPRTMARTYMHMLLHCIFRHMYSCQEFEDKDLFNMCADIAVESILDTDFRDSQVIMRVDSDFRNDCYSRLRTAVKVLTAERLYRFFDEKERDFDLEQKIAREFQADDHSFWERLKDDAKTENKTDSDLFKDIIPKTAVFRASGREWEKTARRIRTEMEGFGKKGQKEYGSLSLMLQLHLRKRHRFGEFLNRMSIYSEELHVDPDAFDYGLYNYGMEFYGNMPIIEQNEYCEGRKIKDFVMAIDTSASCSDALVRRFLEETCSILQDRNRFFTDMNVHIIECDDAVQKDILIKNADDLREYSDGFEVKGRYGTDYRPVFEYVDRLIKKGRMAGLKGLMYFTDGFGIYPEEGRSYETAFVFPDNEETDEDRAPDWVLKLYI